MSKRVRKERKAEEEKDKASVEERQRRRIEKWITEKMEGVVK